MQSIIILSGFNSLQKNGKISIIGKDKHSKKGEKLYFRLNTKSKIKESKTMLKPKLRPIDDIIPVYPKIGTKIPKKENSSEISQGISPVEKPDEPKLEYVKTNGDFERDTMESNLPSDAFGPYEAKLKTFRQSKHHKKKDKSIQPFDAAGPYEKFERKRKHISDANQLKPKIRCLDSASLSANEIKQSAVSDGPQNVFIRIPPEFAQSSTQESNQSIHRTFNSSNNSPFIQSLDPENTQAFYTEANILLRKERSSYNGQHQNRTQISMSVENVHENEGASMFAQKVQRFGKLETFLDQTNSFEIQNICQISVETNYTVTNTTSSFSEELDDYLLRKRNSSQT